MKKEKILVSLIVAILVALVIGNVSSLATDLTDTDKKTGTIKPTNTASQNEEKEDKDTNKANTVGAVKDDKDNNTNKNTNTNINTNTNKSKTSNTANNTNSVGKLPYAGSNTSLVFVVIALVASALYAYKKVSDYNV